MTVNFVPNTDKMHSNNRELKLSVIEGADPLNSKNSIDKRLFTGDNKLYAILNPQTALWNLQYDKGGVPGPLQGTWTTFQMAFKEAKAYFNKRNVEITEIID